MPYSFIPEIPQGGQGLKIVVHSLSIVVMRFTLSKLHVDIKFEIFNLKVKNHLFSLPVLL
jgi:hypothetical protein